MTTTNPELEQEARKKSFVTIGKKKITPVMIAFAKWHGQNAKNLAMLQRFVMNNCLACVAGIRDILVWCALQDAICVTVPIMSL